MHTGSLHMWRDKRITSDDLINAVSNIAIYSAVLLTDPMAKKKENVAALLSMY